MARTEGERSRARIAGRQAATDPVAPLRLVRAAITRGESAAPHCRTAVPAPCPRCGARALLPLDAERAKELMHDALFVCHPLLDGCNVGFGLIETGSRVL